MTHTNSLEGTTRVNIRRSSTRSARAHPAVVGLSLLVSGLTFLTGCGSDDPDSPAATASAGPGNLGQMDPGQMQKIQECLSAAGLATPSAMPTGTPTAMPTGMPTATPTGRPPNGGGNNTMNSPEAQAALKACGIEMPTSTAGPRQ